MSALATPSPKARFDLELVSYPQPNVVYDVCRLIYRSSDPKLAASMHSTPYVVGRSFSREEQENLAKGLQELQVGFTFRSRPPFTEVVTFNPNEAPQEPVSGDMVFRFLNFKRILLLGILILGTGVLAYGAYRFISSGLREQTTQDALEESIGDAKINFTQGRVEHRRQRALQWEPSNIGVSLQNRDAVRTLSDSKSQIAYRGGQAIELGENSYIVIGDSQMTQENVLKHAIDLEDGELSAELTATSQAQEFEVSTPQGKIKLRSPKTGETSKNRVEAEVRGDELRVAVVEGSAQFTSIDSQEPIEITPQSELRQTEGQVPRLKQVVPIVLTSPADQHRFANNEKFIFSWRSQAGVTQYELFISSDPEMRDVLLVQRSLASELELSFLDSGPLYWQVRAETPSGLYRSGVRQVHVP
jgi:hypothetical protein